MKKTAKMPTVSEGTISVTEPHLGLELQIWLPKPIAASSGTNNAIFFPHTHFHHYHKWDLEMPAHERGTRQILNLLIFALFTCIVKIIKIEKPALFINPLYFK